MIVRHCPLIYYSCMQISLFAYPFIKDFVLVKSREPRKLKIFRTLSLIFLKWVCLLVRYACWIKPEYRWRHIPQKGAHESPYFNIQKCVYIIQKSVYIHFCFELLFSVTQPLIFVRGLCLLDRKAEGGGGGGGRRAWGANLCLPYF